MAQEGLWLSHSTPLMTMMGNRPRKNLKMGPKSAAHRSRAVCMPPCLAICAIRCGHCLPAILSYTSRTLTYVRATSGDRGLSLRNRMCVGHVQFQLGAAGSRTCSQKHLHHVPKEEIRRCVGDVPVLPSRDRIEAPHQHLHMHEGADQAPAADGVASDSCLYCSACLGWAGLAEQYHRVIYYRGSMMEYGQYKQVMTGHETTSFQALTSCRGVYIRQWLLLPRRCLEPDEPGRCIRCFRCSPPR